jgi:hypothetical protein
MTKETEKQLVAAVMGFKAEKRTPILLEGKGMC